MSKLKQAPMAFTFDDFVFAPVYSDVPSRKAPDTSTKLNLPTTLSIPIVSSPMNTVTEADMLRAMIYAGGTGVLHRYMSIDRQVEITKELLEWGVAPDDKVPEIAWANFFVAIGANGDAMERLDRLLEAGARNFCVDVANGHSEHCIKTVKKIKQLHDSAVIMAGNVCTFDGAYRLADVGTDVVRVGVGGGSVCLTRLVTGHGIPQLSAIEDSTRIKHAFPDIKIVADGGIRSSGDIIKALAIGADAVMLGSLLAGTSDTPGKIHRNPDDTMYKYYHGMASPEGRGSWFGHAQTSFVPEGESVKIPYRGETSKIVEDLVGELRVGMSYAGAYDLEELRENAEWRRITSSGYTEGTPHGK